ncbi:MAG TPA: DUF3662 and FHA domain-containing protein [Solirubrobacteraceae bacterium]|jgi:hypothetical protein|nr:DUF3662 and FHA domain-containing protein [Solirubrobacteraceae bacterium]
MNPLKRLETTLASLLEGGFGRLFRSEVRPIEIARKLTRQMDEHRTASVSRVYAPNEYAVWLSPQDRARYDGVEEDLIDELCAYLLEHARSEDLALVSPPIVTFHTDEDLALGEFGIQARLVRPDDHEEEPAGQGHGWGEGQREGWEPSAGARDWERGAQGSATEQEGWASIPPARPPGRTEPAGRVGSARGAPPRSADEHGQTMIYSGSRRLSEPLQESRARPPRALLLIAGRRLVLPPGGAVLGRSRDCDIVLDDAGVSRRHAHIRTTPEGWTIEDLRSTNGVLLNGRPLRGFHLLRPGDRIELGTTEILFELR